METHDPYSDPGTNTIYNLLFCDDLDLYKSNTKDVASPFSVLLENNKAELNQLADNINADPRFRVLAWNKLRSMGQNPERKDLLAVIVEVGLEGGLDTLAAFVDGTARYINQSGKIIIWETQNETSDQLIADLFSAGSDIVKQIGPWDQHRRPAPEMGNVRLTCLVSDGLYFGEGPIEVLFNDAIGGPALNAATQLLMYLTDEAG
jgi:hypothetical protein